MAISALADVDPTFVEVAKALYGDVDVRELWDLAKNTDAADVHVPAALNAKKKKKPTAPPAPAHSNTGRALMLGAAAEGMGTVRAGQEAHRAINAGTLMSTGSKAAKIGEFGLQATNLGIGMLAARKLSQNAKKKAALAKAAPLKFLRPVKNVLTDEQAARQTRALARGGVLGQRIVAGTAAGTGVLVGHHLGRRSGLKAGQVAKGMLMPKPVNGVKAINAGTLGTGIGRHGRPLGTLGPKTPPPKLSPVATALPKNNLVKKSRGRLKRVPKENGKIIANAVCKSLTWTGEISKVDEDKRTVFGWCSLSEIDGKPVYDLQNDYVPLEEIEKSAYRYVIESRKGGDEHKRVNKSEPLHTADLIESFVVTPEKLEQMGLAKSALPLGWWIGMHVNDDEQWAEVKAGRRKGFSIHGTGSRREMAA